MPGAAAVAARGVARDTVPRGLAALTAVVTLGRTQTQRAADGLAYESGGVFRPRLHPGL